MDLLLVSSDVSGYLFVLADDLGAGLHDSVEDRRLRFLPEI